MSVDAPSGRPCAGARIRFEGGRARLMPGAVVPAGMVAGQFSVLSPGTEWRQLTGTVGGPARHAGYMSLGRAGDAEGWLLAPVPHGAAFAPGCDGAVTAPPGLPVETVALARFQQMACLGVQRLPVATDLDAAVVIGSGPVAWAVCWSCAGWGRGRCGCSPHAELPRSPGHLAFGA